MRPGKEMMRIAVIGAGAVSENGHLPASRLCPAILLTHLVDLNSERARTVGDRFKIPNTTADYRELFGKVDAVVVATPPSSHARISIDCIRNGLHVLCEKPLATSVAEGNEMVAASKETHRHLGVGMIRRLSWSSQLLKELIRADFLGDVWRFEAEEGGEFNWPLRTGHLFQKGPSGGVIADTGTHLFDLFLWILDGQSADIMSCTDDNWGGVGVNAVTELAIERPAGRVKGRVELSFTRNLRNIVRICGERGYLEASSYGSGEVRYYPNAKVAKPVTLRPEDGKSRDLVDEFALQLSNFVDSIRDNSKKYVSADEVLPTMALIEACRRLRRTDSQPWQKRHLEPFFERQANCR